MVAENSTVGSSTYENIKRDIIFGRIEPSSKLKLGALKERYGASVSTLREMLNRLASDGFVIAQEQRGFFVTPISRSDLIEVSNLRILLECHALQLSIENGTTEWEGNVVAAHHKLYASEKKILEGDKSEIDRWKRRDWEFHLALIEACDNANLLRLHAIIYDKYLRYQMLMLTYRGKTAVDEHREIFKATLERDASNACMKLRGHIEIGLVDVLEKFDKRI